MAKDPAALIYIDKWISSTNGMQASFRAWYFDLLLYQYDKGELPNDEDELAGICRVRPSEYNLFKQMVEQVDKRLLESEIIRECNDQVGVTHWNWKGGISEENNKIRNSAEMHQWRRSVFNRDGYKCTHCLSTKNLQAHHVKPFADYPDLRFDIKNGMTLCKKCHTEEHKRMRND